MLEPRSEVVPLRGLEFHFLDWGDRDAPPVVFLHGFAGHAWQTIFPAQVLAGDHWVIALDQRGHGDSSWADVYGSVPAVADVFEMDGDSVLANASKFEDAGAAA